MMGENRGKKGGLHNITKHQIQTFFVQFPPKNKRLSINTEFIFNDSCNNTKREKKKAILDHLKD